MIDARDLIDTCDLASEIADGLGSLAIDLGEYPAEGGNYTGVVTAEKELARVVTLFASVAAGIGKLKRAVGEMEDRIARLEARVPGSHELDL